MREFNGFKLHVANHYRPRIMFCRSICWFMCILVAVARTSEHSESVSVAGSDDEVTIYRLRTHHPWEKFRDDQPARVTENLEELIMAHDHEREFLMPETQHNFKKHIAPVPYYGTTAKDHCKENNGNCSQKCETVGFQTVCSCREGYTLSSPTDCKPVSGCDFVLSGTSGEFTADEDDCQWIIKAPNHHIIEVTLQILRRHYYYNYRPPNAEIYDGNSTAASAIQHIRGDMESTVLRSSGHHILIKTYLGWEEYALQVSYVTGAQYLQIYDQSYGDPQITVSSLSEKEECISLTYSTTNYSALTVTLKQENDEQLQVLNPTFSFERPDGKWTRDIFRIPRHQGASVLKFQFPGDGTRVYNLGKCLNLEYHAIGGQQYRGPETVCRNGGMWSNATQVCICPQGFTGIYCEEGCGPNRYGHNCSKLCSYLPKECEGMMFCTKEMCSCAPGLQGIKCDSRCDDGNYGASCQQRCGQCAEGTPCDRYTGKCYSGCSAGFYPPFCQKTYKLLVNAPEIVAVTFNSMKIRISFENVAGEGEPISYEVQYKEEEHGFWAKLSPRIISNETECEITGLLPGKMYEIRVILIDKDGGRYQTDLPKSNARTECNDPPHADYNLAATDVGESSVVIQWSYEHDETSLLCKIVDFELSVQCGDEHFKFPIMEKEGSMSLSDMMPDTSYSFQLTGRIVTGKRSLPVEVAVHTLPAAPKRVRNVKAAPLVSGRQLNVTWQPPWNSEDESLRYRVSYQCIHLLACEDVSCNTSSKETEVSSTVAVLDHLQPHALYQIGVTSLSVGGIVSESYIIKAVTGQAAPHVTPSAAENPILAVTNTSALLSWLPPQDCSAVNGYIYGYSYAVVENDTEEIVQQGTVPENIQSVNFSGLAPNHCYDAHITVVASGGASVSNLLIIPFCTSSSAPDHVQSLSVYKRGRRMVGLRWALPTNTYGDIEYFTIIYSTEGSNKSRKLTIQPKHCGAWVDLYCHTVSGLSPGKKYRFEVQARNKEVHVDGEPTEVEAITLEGASSPPVNLRIINATESSMLIEWGMPDKINGQLRSFIIIIEQIDTQVNSYECCDDIPLQDYRVASEEPVYQYEITGLSAASTYSVTVSAKTVTLGEETRIICHTYPPKPSWPQNALTVVKTENSSDKPVIVTLQMQPAQRISGVNRTYILLCLTNSSTTQQPFDDLDLPTLLQSRFSENYHLISEFTQEEAENQSDITFNLKELELESTQAQSLKYALILIQDYMGNRNIDIFVSVL